MRGRLAAVLLMGAVGLTILPLPGTPQPADLEALYSEGVEARHAGRFEQAVELLREAATLDPENADVQVHLGLALAGLGDLDAAEAALERALDLAPDYHDARVGLARIAMRREDPDEAERRLAPVLDEAPEYEDAVSLSEQITDLRQALRLEEEREQEARRAEEAERAAQARQEALARHAREARELRTAGRFAEAESRYRQALALAPEDIDLLVGLAMAQAAREDYRGARTSLEQALDLDHASVDARLGLARVAFWSGEVEEAQGRLTRILEATPDHAEALMLGAQISMAQDRPDEAESFYLAALRAQPDNADALVGLGDVRRARFRENEAREAYRQALSLRPGDEDIQARLDVPPPIRWRIDVDGLYSSLSGPQDPWREVYFRIAHHLTPETTLSVGLELSERFDMVDTYIEGRVDHRFSSRFAAHVLVGGTPNADFRPRYRVAGGAEMTVSESAGDHLGPTVATIALRHDDYASGNIQTISPGLRQHFLDDRLSVTGRWIHTIAPGRHLNGWFARADLALHEDVNVFFGASDAPETSEGVVIETASVFGGVSYDVNRNLVLRASLAHESRDRAADRTVFSLGTGVRF